MEPELKMKAENPLPKSMSCEDRLIGRYTTWRPLIGGPNHDISCSSPYSTIPPSTQFLSRYTYKLSATQSIPHSRACDPGSSFIVLSNVLAEKGSIVQNIV